MTTETLMTGTTQTADNAAASAQEGSAADAAAKAGAAAQAGDQASAQQQAEVQGAEGQAAGDTKAVGDKSSDDKANKAESASGSYQFQAPDGVELDPAVTGAFSEVAKELGLPQESAQKVLDKMAPILAARQSEQIQSARADWLQASKADKEFGGERLAENLGVAKRALDAFATPELRELLDASGLGDHPEIIRAFYRAGKAISEDGFVAGQAGKTSPRDARRLYSASNMNP